jgi:predicted RNase H-like HicB family nuclease
MAKRTFAAVYEPCAFGGGYTGFVLELPNAVTHGETLDDARQSLQKMIEVIVDVNRRAVLAHVNADTAIHEEITVGA